MLTLSQAIARMEGYGANPLNRPTRNNNPGDIEWGDFARNHGATRVEIPAGHQPARFAYFPDAETGFAAMKVLLLLHYKGKTISQVIAKYAPSNENDTARYIQLVCEWTGLTPETVVDERIV